MLVGSKRLEVRKKAEHELVERQGVGCAVADTAPHGANEHTFGIRDGGDDTARQIVLHLENVRRRERPVEVSAHRWPPASTSIRRTLTRVTLPAGRTVPSSRYRAPTSDDARASAAHPLAASASGRGTTRR